MIEITWKADNTKKRGIPAKAIVTEERSLESVTSSIFIPDVVLEDEGGYYCSVRIGLRTTLSQTAYLEEISKHKSIATSLYVHTYVCICSYSLTL